MPCAAEWNLDSAVRRPHLVAVDGHVHPSVRLRRAMPGWNDLRRLPGDEVEVVRVDPLTDVMAQLERAPVARAKILVRAPAKDAYDAFVQPETLTKFWLANASAPLTVGQRVRWRFMVPGAADDVDAKVLEPNERIVVAWSDGTTTEWTFDPCVDGGTIVTVEQSGFTGSGDEIVATAIEATQGYTLVLSDLKLLLERGSAMNLVKDKATLITDHLETKSGP